MADSDRFRKELEIQGRLSNKDITGGSRIRFATEKAIYALGRGFNSGPSGASEKPRPRNHRKSQLLSLVQLLRLKKVKKPSNCTVSGPIALFGKS